ncbi:PD40 domain-containing protein [Pseudarthrobacter sp. NamB4]|uniref:PD40 domain-containing protein n=1 Tax=Pseudarthrobacter sp. NamB4 TaxID=2576837 RepID=UPI0010FE2B81|nr:PD40 domain-containing protein [Pseudarthrobacter sp. NamB4]TLM72447.1 hypothetical protein FDW81_13040 [Pseudarthrobacter sp. NamB4]
MSFGATAARGRLLLLLVVVVFTLAAAGVYGVSSFQQARSSQEAASMVETATADALPAEPFIIFQNTAPGQGNGQAAFVDLADPSGIRSLTGLMCDRVYGTRQLVSCLATRNEVPTRFEAVAYSSSLQPQQSWVLAGSPSRTRVSPDGSLLASTVFVTGHSYTSAWFSTETIIRGTDGTDYGNLEQFALLSGGNRIAATDGNIWGVTFVPGHPTEFYATASSGESVWLVKGNLTEQTLTVVASGVECPSISPDGKRIAFKKSATGKAVGMRHPAVLDIATGSVTVLTEQRNVDDQIEWLDNSTVLYGMPRDEASLDSDIWKLSIEAGSAPELFIQHAWSPAVVR